MKNHQNLYYNGVGLVSARKGKSTKYWGVCKSTKSQRYIVRVLNELVQAPQSVSITFNQLTDAAEMSALMYYLLTRKVLKYANSNVLYETRKGGYYKLNFRAGNWIICEPIKELNIGDYTFHQAITQTEVFNSLSNSIKFHQETEEVQSQEKLEIEEVTEPTNVREELDEESEVEFEEDNDVDDQEIKDDVYLPHERTAAAAVYKAIIENGVEASDTFKKFIKVINDSIN